jgi:hypothetical protein
MEKTPNQAHFSKFSKQSVGLNFYRKNEKTASTETKKEFSKPRPAF